MKMFNRYVVFWRDEDFDQRISFVLADTADKAADMVFDREQMCSDTTPSSWLASALLDVANEALCKDITDNSQWSHTPDDEEEEY